MLDKYQNTTAKLFFSRLKPSEVEWAHMVIDELRRRSPMADHWTTGKETEGRIDIRIGRRLKSKSKGLPTFYVRKEQGVALRVNKSALPEGAIRVLSIKEAPELAQVQQWLDSCRFTEAGLKRLEGSGFTPADYGDTDVGPDEEGIDEDVDEAQLAEMAQHPLNLILYGPPGTGKTYRTISEALKIIESTTEPAGDFDAQKERFDSLRREGRISFITFHQSFSYEDFIEGIRAETSSGQLSYQLRDGVFKRMAIRAMYRPAGDIATVTQPDFDDLYDEFLKEIGASMPYAIVGAQGGKMEIGGITDRGTLQVIHPGRTLKHGVSRPRMKLLYEAYSTVEDFEKMPARAAIIDVIGGANITAYWGAFKRLLVFKDKVGEELLQQANEVLSAAEEEDYEQIKQRVLSGNKLRPNGKPYVLIIDEINRANMSRVFGELITLIEPSKRAGRPESAEVQLPYSGDRFSVPLNLYLIGTMNTADRSLAVVDTALRRRFDFVEMMPNPGLIKCKQLGGVDVVRLLETINLRIEHLYDREHTIGHSFFMELNQDSTLADLARIFRNSVLPLLEEYFFEDWEKIALVLGNAGIYEPRPAADLGFSHAGKIYRRNLERLQLAATYHAIYRHKNEQPAAAVVRSDV